MQDREAATTARHILGRILRGGSNHEGGEGVHIVIVVIVGNKLLAFLEIIIKGA